MRKDDQQFFADDAPLAKSAARRAEAHPRRQRVRGVAGQLRPYGDVRAGFEPWRRVALVAWASRDEGFTVH